MRDRLSELQRAKFNRGTYIGVLARDLFPGGKNAVPPSHFHMKKSVEQTKQWIGEGVEIIYEAGFENEGVVIALDILEKTNSGWNAYEVKSSREVSETYMWDAALQAWVIIHSGLKLEKFFIIHINPDYILEGSLNLDKLFVKKELTEYVFSQQGIIEEKVGSFAKTLALKNSPAIPIGLHCHKPYPCDFIGHCWKNVPRDSALLLPGIKKQEDFESFLNNSIQSPENNPLLQIYIKSKDRQLPYINSSIKPQLDAIHNGTICFVNAVSIAPGVPLFKTCKAFEIIPLAMSVSIYEKGKRIKTEQWQKSSMEPEWEQLYSFLQQNIKPEIPVFLADSSPLLSVLKHYASEAGFDPAWAASVEKNISSLMDWFDNLSLIVPNPVDTSDVITFYKSLGIIDNKDQIPFRVQLAFDYWMQLKDAITPHSEVFENATAIVNNELTIIDNLIDWLSNTYSTCVYFDVN